MSMNGKNGPVQCILLKSKCKWFRLHVFHRANGLFHSTKTTKNLCTWLFLSNNLNFINDTHLFYNRKIARNIVIINIYTNSLHIAWYYSVPRPLSFTVLYTYTHIRSHIQFDSTVKRATILTFWSVLICPYVNCGAWCMFVCMEVHFIALCSFLCVYGCACMCLCVCVCWRACGERCCWVFASVEAYSAHSFWRWLCGFRVLNCTLCWWISGISHLTGKIMNLLRTDIFIGFSHYIHW